MKFIFFLFSILFLISGLVQGDTPDGDMEITVHSGWSFLDIEREREVCPVCEIPVPVGFMKFRMETQASPTVGFKFGYYLNDHAEIEGAFQLAPNHDLIVNSFFDCPPGRICPLLFPFFEIRQNFVIYQYNAGFVYNILKNDIRPFLSFGVGGLTTDFEGDSENDFVFHIGAGTKFYFRNTGLRFEVQDYIIPDYFLSRDTEHNVQISYGFVFRLK